MIYIRNLLMINSADLEHTSCPLCNCIQYDKAYDQFRPYAVVRCRSCNFFYLSPRLTETAMMKIYSNNTYFEGKKGGYTSYTEQEMALRATFHRLMINLRKRNLTGGALLEIGCGYGYLLEEAKAFFETRVGTDFSYQAVEQARKRADHIYRGTIDHIPANDRFDCIIATQVIEHVYQPKAFLEKLCGHLKERGKMVVATPDFGSFWRRLMGRYWPSFKIPEHILYFDKKSLATLMQQAGLINIISLPYPHAFPLSLIAAKLHISLPPVFDKRIVWLHRTTIAMYGVFNGQ
jgi:2-polyprenyl-3-methyl-5-hydroxy-6-metoxy-1,4-benzoquinol methylase